MTQTFVRFLSIAALLGAVAADASAQPAEPPPAPAATASVPDPANPDAAAPVVDSSYLLGPGDVVEISLVGRSDFSSRARVDAQGLLLLPMIGSIQAADRTVIDFADDVRKALIKGGFFTDPVVRVEVASITSRYITVLGAVGRPGLIPLDRNYRLSEILAKIGGRTDAGVDYVLLTRDGAKEPMKFDIAALGTATGDADPVVKSGDKLFIPLAANSVIYMSGQVNGPGPKTVTEGMTFRYAIAKSGGVTPNGNEKKIKVIRDGKPLKGVKLDDLVQVGDIVEIGERLF